MNATQDHGRVNLKRTIAAFALAPLVAACLGSTPQVGPEVANRAHSSAAASPGADVIALAAAQAATARAVESAKPASSKTISSVKPSTKPARQSKPAPTPSPGRRPHEVMAVTPYFLLRDDMKLVPVYRIVDKTPRGARAALNELLRGPDEAETSLGIRSEIPAGTKLRDVSIKNGIATVDLSKPFEANWGGLSKGARLAQVVFTLTHFAHVDRVALLIEGKPSTEFEGQYIIGKAPVTRSEFMDYVPSVFVESPSLGALSGSHERVRVTGTSNFRHGEFRLTLFRGGTSEKIADVPVRSRCGTWCWEDFDVTLPVTIERYETLTLQVYTPVEGGGAEDIRTFEFTADELAQPEDFVAGDGCGC